MDHLAIDIGASGGRIFSGKLSRSRHAGPIIELEEIYRFENRIMEKGGRLIWDIDRIFEGIISGLRTAAERGIRECTAGIDTWGVDYVLIDRHGGRVSDVYCYRDHRTDRVMGAVHEIMPKDEIYRKTGIQFLQFNTLYQLFAHDKDDLKRARKILLIPDYLYFLLTGKCFNEATNASTTQLLNLTEKDFDSDLLALAGVERDQFSDLIYPGRSVGSLNPDLKKRYNLPEVSFVSAATHDTGSAVAGTPLMEKDSVYLSSGTWSLMGMENDCPVNSPDALACNFTNEWGAGNTYRFLKNLTGLWLIQEVKRNFKNSFGFKDLMEKAVQNEPFKYLIDCNDSGFLNPGNMIGAIKSYCERTGQETPGTPGEISRCIMDSLALSYRLTLEEIEQLTGQETGMINIIGGGVKNSLLCQLTSDITGKRVLAGPSEATVWGNILIQMVASKEIESISAGRGIIRDSFITDEYMPADSHGAGSALNRYRELIKHRKDFEHV